MAKNPLLRLQNNYIRAYARLTRAQVELSMATAETETARKELETALTIKNKAVKIELNEEEKAIAKTDRIGAIKALRARYGQDQDGNFVVPLKDAKEIVDKYFMGVQ